MLALAAHTESFLGDIHDCPYIVSFVLFANEELVIGGERNSAALANQTNERTEDHAFANHSERVDSEAWHGLRTPVAFFLAGQADDEWC